ncbi:MAG: carbohydrate ABC transporter permease [Scrofimicrobium sp.]
MISKTLRRAPGYLFLAIFALFSLFPLYFMVVSATNTSSEVLGAKMLPGGAFLENWNNLVATTDLPAAVYHSTVNATVTTVLALIICSLAGYGFEIYHSRGKDILMSIILLAMMIPFAATMIPLFQLFAGWGMINSTMAVVLPAVATPFLILLFRQSSRTFPHETIEAARIDGLGEISIFTRIYVPMMKPTFAAATVITFMNAWNAFMWPRVILVSNKYQTLPLLTSNLTAGYVTDYGMLMLAVLISSLPTMIIFLVLQKSFANGVMGAVK